MHLEVHMCGYNKPINTEVENERITRVSYHKCILHFNIQDFKAVYEYIAYLNRKRGQSTHSQVD